MRIWRAVRGECSELGNRSQAWGTPLARGEGPGPRKPLPPHAEVETGWRWGVGVVEGCWKTRDNGGKAAWLFIGVLSSVYWINGVITDDELAVLIICACSSWNLLIKHHFNLHFGNFCLSFWHISLMGAGLTVATVFLSDIFVTWSEGSVVPVYASFNVYFHKFLEKLHSILLAQK